MISSRTLICAFLASFLCGACQIAEAETTRTLLRLQAQFGDTNWPLREPQIPSFSYQDLEPGEIRIQWIAKGEVWPTELPAELLQTPLAKEVEALVALVYQSVIDTFQLSFVPGAVVTLVETDAGCRLKVAASTWLDRGLALSIPIRQQQLSPQTAEYLLTTLAHEYSESLLIFPDVFGCQLYKKSRYNRWVGDGVAELVTTFARQGAKEGGFDISGNPDDLRALRSLLADGQQTVNLANWPALDAKDSQAGRQTLEQSVAHYAAAEYVCWLWFQQAERQMPAPIASLAEWVAQQPPSKEALLRWMEASSQLDLAEILVAVPLQDVLTYKEGQLRN